MKKIVILLSVLFIFSLFSCDFIITPQRGRENPNDPSCPVGDFSVVATGTNSVRISFQQPEVEWDEMGEPGALWILYRANSEASSVDDWESGNAAEYAHFRWGELVNWSDGSQFSYSEGSIDNPDTNAVYYFSAFWTYDDDIDTDRLIDYEWVGPVSDTAVFQTTTMTLNPTIDGYVSEGGGSGFSDTEMYFGYGYNYISLIKFDAGSLPSSITEATLNLVYRWGSQDASYDVYLIGQDWDESTNYTAASGGDFTVADGNNPVEASSPSGRADGDSISVDVTGLMDIWQNNDQGYGFKISSDYLYQTAVYTKDFSDAYAPSLILTYYPED